MASRLVSIRAPAGRGNGHVHPIQIQSHAFRALDLAFSTHTERSWQSGSGAIWERGLAD